MERKLEDKDRELHAIKLDNEAVSLMLVLFICLSWLVELSNLYI